jgi:hypothetical protein
MAKPVALEGSTVLRLRMPPLSVRLPSASIEEMESVPLECTTVNPASMHARSEGPGRTSSLQFAAVPQSVPVPPGPPSKVLVQTCGRASPASTRVAASAAAAARR